MSQFINLLSATVAIFVNLDEEIIFCLKNSICF